MTNRVSKATYAAMMIAGLAIHHDLHAQCANTSTVGIVTTCFGNDSMVNAPATAIFDTAFGTGALGIVTTGSTDVALGDYALGENTSGSDNTGVGHAALANITTGNKNTAVGSWSIAGNTTGDGNTAVGYNSMEVASTGSYNTATGFGALLSDTAGSYNVATGANALDWNSTGIDNTAVGDSALANERTGNANLALGAGAGVSYSGAESFNVVIANNGVTGDNNVMRLGATGVQTKTFVAGIHGVTSSSGIPVYVNTLGQLGTATSSLRFKEDVADMGAASDVLMQLRPVTFHYKAPYDDGQRVLQYGLIAEEVAAIDPGLVQLGDDGLPLTVRYHFVNAMLLGEVQKQHAKLADQAALLALQTAEMVSQKAEIASQKTAMAALSDRLAKLEAALATAHR